MTLIYLFHSLPYFARADDSLAGWAESVELYVDHPNPSHSNQVQRGDDSPCIKAYFLQRELQLGSNGRKIASRLRSHSFT